MAHSCRNARCRLLGAVIAAATGAAQALVAATPGAQAVATAVSAALPGHQLPITVDAASSEVDYRTNMVVFSRW